MCPTCSPPSVVLFQDSSTKMSRLQYIVEDLIRIHTHYQLPLRAVYLQTNICCPKKNLRSKSKHRKRTVGEDRECVGARLYGHGIHCRTTYWKSFLRAAWSLFASASASLATYGGKIWLEMVAAKTSTKSYLCENPLEDAGPTPITKRSSVGTL